MIKKSERGGLKMLINFKDMEMREVPGGSVCAGDEELAPFCL